MILCGPLKRGFRLLESIAFIQACVEECSEVGMNGLYAVEYVKEGLVSRLRKCVLAELMSSKVDSECNSTSSFGM